MHSVPVPGNSLGYVTVTKRKGNEPQGIAAQFFANRRRDFSENSRTTPRLGGSGASSASRNCQTGSSVRSNGSFASRTISTISPADLSRYRCVSRNSPVSLLSTIPGRRPGANADNVYYVRSRITLSQAETPFLPPRAVIQPAGTVPARCMNLQCGYGAHRVQIFSIRQQVHRQRRPSRRLPLLIPKAGECPPNLKDSLHL